MDVLKNASMVLLLLAVCVEAFHVQVGKVPRRCKCRRRGRRMVQNMEEMPLALEEMCALTRIHCTDYMDQTPMGTQHQRLDATSMGVQEFILASQASKLTDALETLCRTAWKVCKPTATRKLLVASPWRLRKERRRVQKLIPRQVMN